MPAWVLRVLRAARRVPWSRVLAAVTWLRIKGPEYWNRLTPAERSRLLDLLKKSKGRRSNLTKREQDRVVELLRKVWEGRDSETK